MSHFDDAPTLLTADGIGKTYIGEKGTQVEAIGSVSFSVREGEFVAIVGPSGCGKTTLLRAVAGLEPVSAGEIRLGGEVVSRAGSTLAPELRRIGMVFQDYALFPHLDVGQNVGFGIDSLPRTQRATRVAEVLDLVGLSGAERRYPHELSGGQQQRVALARALAPEPRLLLLDEPFSNLDVDLRERLAHEVRAILKAAQATAQAAHMAVETVAALARATTPTTTRRRTTSPPTRLRASPRTSPRVKRWRHPASPQMCRRNRPRPRRQRASVQPQSPPGLPPTLHSEEPRAPRIHRPRTPSRVPF